MHTLPEFAELLFVRTIATGTVHVVLSVPAWTETDDPPAMSIADGLAKIAGGESPTTVLCGRKAELAGTRYERVGCFGDDDLCHGCYRALPAGERWRAFEHPTPTAA